MKKQSRNKLTVCWSVCHYYKYATNKIKTMWLMRQFTERIVADFQFTHHLCLPGNFLETSASLCFSCQLLVNKTRIQIWTGITWMNVWARLSRICPMNLQIFKEIIRKFVPCKDVPMNERVSSWESSHINISISIRCFSVPEPSRVHLLINNRQTEK